MRNLHEAEVIVTAVIWVLAGITVLAAAIALLSSHYSRREVRTGRATAYSLADLTGICDRDALDALFGPAESDGRYAVSPEQVSQVRQPLWKRSLDNDVLDGLDLLTALLGVMLFSRSTWIGGGLVAIAATHQIIGYVVAARQMLRDPRLLD